MRGEGVRGKGVRGEEEIDKSWGTCCNGSVGGDARHCHCVTGNVVLEP